MKLPFYKGLPVNHLKLGMYVSRLDVPWEQTDFPLQGLLIKSVADIEKLSQYCQRVWIDEERSRGELHKNNSLPPKSGIKTKAKIAANFADYSIAYNWKKKHCVEQYAIQSSMKREIVRSAKLFDGLEKQIHNVCTNIIHCHTSDIEKLVDSTSQVVDSIIRNPDAFAWLCRIRDTREPIYTHIIRLAIWGGIVGRQLGLNHYSLTHLSSALLFTGIGKSTLSKQVLEGYHPSKARLEYQCHLHETLYQLQQIRFSTDGVINTIENYCERIDGSGFPLNKTVNEIPFLSQVAGLIETYELMISPYDISHAVSPSSAVVYLNRYKGKFFDASLVEEFIKAIGIYPTGTLVELSDDQKGIIFSQDYERRLRASVIPIINSHGTIANKYRVLDLSCADHREGDSGDNQLYIRKGVPASNIPRGLLEDAHNWMFKRNRGVKGMIQSILG
ncbi:HD-GYP domain-containing protein [Aurantivibrio plasticivorans]